MHPNYTHKKSMGILSLNKPASVYLYSAPLYVYSLSHDISVEIWGFPSAQVNLTVGRAVKDDVVADLLTGFQLLMGRFIFRNFGCRTSLTLTASVAISNALPTTLIAHHAATRTSNLTLGWK